MHFQQPKILFAQNSITKHHANPPHRFSKFQLHSLALRACSKPLEEFYNVKELLGAFADAVEAFEQAHILHGDVSPGNILIGENGRGFLVDWDVPKPALTSKQRDGYSLLQHAGTWQFIAYRLVAGRGPIGSARALPTKDDDLESFWHVLFWIALRRGQHVKETEHVKHVLFNIYDSRRQFADYKYAAAAKKHILHQSRYIAKNFQFTSSPLATVLEKYLAVINKRYIVNDTSKQLLLSWRNSFLAEHDGMATDQQIGLHLWSKIYSQNLNPKSMNDTINPINPGEFLMSLQPNWTSKLLRNLYTTTTDAQWSPGGSNRWRLTAESSG